MRKVRVTEFREKEKIGELRVRNERQKVRFERGEIEIMRKKSSDRGKSGIREGVRREK